MGMAMGMGMLLDQMQGARPQPHGQGMVAVEAVEAVIAWAGE